MSRNLHAEMERLRGTVRARSSVTGRFVSLLYALKHKATTVIENIKK